MIYGIGEITYEELSPELQKRIDSSTGGVSTVAGLMVIDGVFTKKVTATTPEQTEFEIPFSDYDSLNSHLDIKINSTWINPERYQIVGNKIVLNDGVEIGTNVFFTLFSLAQPTGDGGFIEDVEVAETPQEVIVYDGEIINEKVNEGIRGHNASGEAHADIRELTTAINGKVEVLESDRGYLITKELRNTDLNTVTKNGMYLFNPYPTLGNTNCPLQGEDATFSMIVSGGGSTVITQLAIKGYPHTNSRMFMRGCTNGSWGEWKEIATTETTTALDNKIGVLETDRGYLTSRNFTSNLQDVINNGFYTLWGGSTIPLDFAYSNIIATKGLDVRNIAQIALDCTGKGLAYRGGKYEENPEWQEIATTEPTVVTIPNNTDLATYMPQMKENKIYRQVPNTGTLNAPSTSLYCFYSRVGSVIIGMVFDNSITSYYITNIVNGGFYGWNNISTTSKINNLSLLNGWQVVNTDGWDVLSVTKSGGIATINGRIKNTSSIQDGNIIATLPSEYRPSTSRRVIAFSGGNGATTVALDIRSDGNIMWYGGSVSSVSQLRLNGISYPVG